MTLLALRPRVRRAAIVLLTTGLATAAVAVGSAPAATADTKPASGTPTTVATDVLPTAQLNGVAWTQTVIGNIVYVGGNFTKARPAGAAAGTNEVTRGGMLAYDVTTGKLTGFAASFNSAVRAIAPSSDGRTIYAVGNFTTVNGVARSRIAALDATTGALISSFAPSLNSTGLGVAVHNTTVYAVGAFTSASGQTRSHAAAFSTAGAITPWAPTADQNVRTVLASPDGASVVLGGHFASLNGATVKGSARVDSGSGKSNLAWYVNAKVQNNGPDSAIYSLSTDGTYVYATGYAYSPQTPGPHLEGAYAASWANGTVRWIEDCHGDSYSSAPFNGALYIASHSHACTNVPGGFPDVLNPDGTRAHFQRATAFSLNPVGTLKTETSNYSNFGGNPAPGLLDWFPDLSIGTYSGQNQAAWSVATSAGKYVVYAGEFPKVNGVAQQGLVRFAVPSIAPNHDGPRVSGAGFVPTLTAMGGGKVAVKFQTNYDRDNESLNYVLYRDGNTTTPTATFTLKSRIWYQRPTLSWVNSGMAVGSTHSYRLKVYDPWGNTAWGSSASITVK